MKIVLNNSELSEIIKDWSEKKFSQSAEVSITNKKNGIEVTVNLYDSNKEFDIVPEELIATGCCEEVAVKMYETSADEEAQLEAN